MSSLDFTRMLREARKDEKVKEAMHDDGLTSGMMTKKSTALATPPPLIDEFFPLINRLQLDRRDFVSESEEKLLLDEIYTVPMAERWNTLKGRRVQIWGGTPVRTGLVKEALPGVLLPLRDRLVECGVFDRQPNHALINEYDHDQGIMAHKDGPVYFPRVAITSLGGSTLFQFSESQKGDPVLELLIEPRSLLIFEDAAYEQYFHAIPARMSDTISNLTANSTLPMGSEVPRSLRVSITLRIVPTVEEVNNSKNLS